jgi:MSHA biogenesis protein MshO
MSPARRRLSGFTLIELIVAIVLAAIVASFMVLFLEAPMQDYFAQTRRADLVDSANRIAGAVAADVRTALPNSLRFAVNGSSKGLELLATAGVARYYGQGDKNGGPGELPICLTLPCGSVNSFTTLDTFVPQAAGTYLSVGNLGIPPTYDAYNAANKVMMAAAGITVGPNPGTPGENLVTSLPSAPIAFQAPAQPPAHNAYLVTGPVSYVCNPNPANPAAGTFLRYSGYGITTAQAVPPAGPGGLIAHNVASCTISYLNAATGYPFGELAVLTITLASGSESLEVFLELPTEYSQ